MQWQNRYLYCDNTDSIVQALQDALTRLGYSLYNPFGMIPGNAYPHTIKVFVAPPVNGWTRIIGMTDEPISAAVSHLGMCMEVTLNSDESRKDIYHPPALHIFDKGQNISFDVLAAHVREGYTVAILRDILAGKQITPAAVGAKAADIPLNILPQDVQAMAKDLDSRQISSMFGKMMKKVQGYLPGDASAARDLLAEAEALWQSPAGQQLSAFMAGLTLSKKWREPDFIAVRDAYQLHLRRQQRPNAALYPGDAEAMDAVPDALTYQPIYGGKTP